MSDTQLTENEHKLIGLGVTPARMEEAVMTARGSIIMDCSSCPRCKKSHSGITFRQFVNPVALNRAIVFQYWGTCPTTEEPILIEQMGIG